MGRLTTLKPRVRAAESRLKPLTIATVRMSGRKLQDRRLRLYVKSPNCAHCGALTLYPSGFELDHITPLYKGGMDTDDNCQILCSGPDTNECHKAKSRADAQAG